MLNCFQNQKIVLQALAQLALPKNAIRDDKSGRHFSLNVFYAYSFFYQ